MSSAVVTTSVGPPRPVEVLHEGAWIAGWLLAYRRDSTGWRAYVRYSTAPGMTYVQWRPELEVRGV